MFSKILRAKYYFMDWAFNSYFCIFLGSILHIIMYASDERLMANYYAKFEGIPSVLLYHFAAILTLCLIQWSKPTDTVAKFDKIRDLVRGTILVKPENLFDAYEHFKKIPGVKILNVRENIISLQNITANYIYRN